MMSVETSEPPEASVLLLRRHLSSCPHSIEELVKFLDSVSDAALLDPENAAAVNNAVEVLSEIRRFLFSPSLDQEVFDALSFELPKAVSKFAGLSDGCLEIAESVISRLITICSPRDMLLILCEALDSPSKTTNASGYVAPLLSGLSKVFLSIQRRQFEQVKVAVPVILKVLEAVSSELAGGDTEDTEQMILFGRALDIADSIREVSAKLEERVKDKLCALLGLYVLQILALLSLSLGYKISTCLSLVSRLSTFFRCCSLSYHGLVTGSDVDVMVNIMIEECTEENYYVSSMSYIKHGACLSVIWGYISDAIAQAAGENMSAFKDELCVNQTERWQAVGMLRHVLSFANLPWELKEHAIDFLLCITDGNNAQSCSDEHTDYSVYMPSYSAAFQVITKVIIYAPNTVLRKNAFEALKRVLAGTPVAQRFDILRSSITNTDSSSMIAILLDLLKGELHKESCQRISKEKDEILQTGSQARPITSLWTSGVLEIIELVLRPPKGGPPSFPEQGDAVLSALNLYRFLLITESAGKTNFTGVLSKNNLQKAYIEWLLPLRTLVTGIMTENQNDHDQFAVDTICALNPVELVLYRCIELVEEKVKH